MLCARSCGFEFSKFQDKARSRSAGGEVCPTITATNPMIYVIEPNEK